jgi:hypothetical protein
VKKTTREETNATERERFANILQTLFLIQTMAKFATILVLV